MTQKKKLTICTAAIIAVCFFIFHRAHSPEKVSSDSTQGTDETEYVGTPLNKCLTNRMSDIPGSKDMDRVINKFMWRWHITGASLAVVKDNKLVYAKGYGWADKEKNVLMSPENVFRVASLSKLITAAAVMKLCEDGFLSLDDRVFGPDGILHSEQFSDIKDPRCMDITVEMLLRHTAGFSRSKGDPMFTTRDIMTRAEMDEVPDMDGMIEYALTQRLGSKPGGMYRYSNLGYLVLTKVVEVCSGMGYEKYCQKKILHPAGCWDMHLAHNLYEERYPNEVRYYETDDASLVESYDRNKPGMYHRTYGGSNIAGLLGGGAWVASPAEYVKFICTIDGDPTISDILKPQSVEMMTYTDKDNSHPLGWINCSEGTWIRTGTLAGVSAMAKKLPDGTIWMFITNTSCWKGSQFTKYISKMMSDAFSRATWPENRNLFEASNGQLAVSNH